jgi:hypothetical protein
MIIEFFVVTNLPTSIIGYDIGHKGTISDILSIDDLIPFFPNV